MNVIFCGLPRTGKSTFGKWLANKLGWDFLDTDILIEKEFFTVNKKELSCRQIYQEEGEGFFREIEKKVLLSLPAMSFKVVALGGGALCSLDNQSIFSFPHLMVHIKVSLPLLWSRIQQGGIPAYLDVKDPYTSFCSLAKLRLPHYEKASHLTWEPELLHKQSFFLEIQSSIYSKTQVIGFKS